jgi:hypothetical protein
MASVANVATNKSSKDLRRSLLDFLADHKRYEGVGSALHDWSRMGWEPLLFGGFLRDLFLFGRTRHPRDIDVVVANGSIGELQQVLSPFIQRKTRFGGLQIEFNRWHFDIWPLEQTWGFKHSKLLVPKRENLPKTTFLNIEAIAVSLGPKGGVGDIYESGFFQAIKSRTLDINFEDNPYPALAAVRSIKTALQISFAMSPRLASYIVTTADSLGVEAFVEAQERHYGKVSLRSGDLHPIVAEVRGRLEENAKYPILLDRLNTYQTSLWECSAKPNPR